MKCNNCNKEIANDLNFCPHCGAKLNDNQTVKVEKHEFYQVTDRTELLSSLCQLGLYTGIGMTLVSLFFAFKGFGLFTKPINPVTVWVTFGVSLAVAITGGLFYFLKFRNKK